MDFARDDVAFAGLVDLLRSRGLPFVDDAVDFADMLADVLPIVIHEESQSVDDCVLGSIDLFLGDLTVRGHLDSAPMFGSCGALLVVLGDLRVGSVVWDGGPMFVGGSLTVDGAALFRSDGFGLFVGRDLRADVFVEEDSGLYIRGAQECRVMYRRGQDASGLFDDRYTYDVGDRRAPDSGPLVEAIRRREPFMKS